VTRRAAALCLVAAALPLGACGGSDEEAAKTTIREFVEATSKRDAGKFCGDLVTEEFLEQTTGAKGERARSACRQQIKSLKGVQIKLVSIGKTTVKGDRATVRTTLETAGQKRPQVFRLQKQDGDWRLSGGSSG